ncbi:phosphoribosylamine--glycine ligase [Roseisolibacter sp. H3M3-2]|uniref:phosphoribosylamine--glycine ligase n=1 Tax=Roseisolibacter sp. H3M3-2 TaxID=3031323 RepID=UPI0023DAB0C9|nr:phosphoribosylamine--glycine ligase [Roseisolibacter sp. H3M3-2]MDF1501591.1 phosphoribosylamine--glycine ligase [Roseisolibacter sp. H3M3-2]
MKVLIIGGGGREHALAWKLRREEAGLEIVAAPGNPGIAQLGRCVPVAASDVEALVALAESERPDWTLVGPEAPLAAGIVDRFRERGLPIFGPTAAAAEIETSKAFAKQLMVDAGVPTARAELHTDAAAAKEAVRRFGAPVVVKASGLAAGKGVIVAQTVEDAERAVDFMLVEGGFGVAGAEVLVEEFMVGEEASCFFLTDGTSWIALPPAQDHKRLEDHDRGPNTGGMGAYAPVSLLETDDGRALLAGVERSVVEPTLRAMRERGRPFTGLLYAGLMLTPDGPQVVEFNCRFGDPETQALLPFLDGVPVGAWMRAIAVDGELPAAAAPGGSSAAVTTVVAAAGYPDRPRTGDPIALPEQVPEGVYLFHAGTALDPDGRLVTAGGRVLAVTAVADTFERARALSRTTAAQVQFAGRQYRTDIGWREAERRREPS